MLACKASARHALSHNSPTHLCQLKAASWTILSFDACLWLTLQIRLALEGKGTVQSGASGASSPANTRQMSSPAAGQQPPFASRETQSSHSVQDMAAAAPDTPVGTSSPAVGAPQAQADPAAAMQESRQEDLQDALSQGGPEPMDPVFDLAGFQVSRVPPVGLCLHHKDER